MCVKVLLVFTFIQIGGKKMKKRSYKVLLLTMLIFIFSTSITFAEEVEVVVGNSDKFGLWTLLPPLVAIILAFIYANKFTIAGMGESFATNLGLNHERIVNIGLILVSAVSALTLVMVGNIPFLGLIVPNLVSISKGDNLKNSLVETCLFGGSFVLLCDIIGRVIIAPYEVSIGLTVGVIGSAMFLYLVMRRKK